MINCIKKVLMLFLLGICTTIYAQEIPTSFPRKTLMEHFTGDQCPNCPAGMNAITEYIQTKDSSIIWVSHHEGYNTDEYTLTESSSIGKVVGLYSVGVPSISLNRTRLVGNFNVFLPSYLLSYPLEIDSVAEASVVIDHSYNSETRQLDATISGLVANTEIENYLLTVLIKENRLVGKQADSQTSWKAAPWLEYMHTRVARKFLTAALGDEVKVENQAFSKTFSITIDKAWVAENCCIVAYITPLSPQRPVINAEQTPLIKGTTGGEQYFPYGITESQAPDKDPITIDSLVQTKISDTILELKLFSKRTIRSSTQGSVKAVLYVYLNTETEKLETGNYPIQEGNALGTITPGYRIDEERTFGGSRLVYAQSVPLTIDNEIIPAHVWRMSGGELVVDETGNFTLNMQTYNGKTAQAIYTAPYTSVENTTISTIQVQKVLYNGQFYILKNGKQYDLFGHTIR